MSARRPSQVHECQTCHRYKWIDLGFDSCGPCRRGTRRVRGKIVARGVKTARAKYTWKELVDPDYVEPARRPWRKDSPPIPYPRPKHDPNSITRVLKWIDDRGAWVFVYGWLLVGLWIGMR